MLPAAASTSQSNFPFFGLEQLARAIAPAQTSFQHGFQRRGLSGPVTMKMISALLRPLGR